MPPAPKAPPQPLGPSPLVAFFWSGDVLRSRSVGPSVLVGHLDLPAAPARLTADWDRDIAQQLALEPGDVESLSLARARTRWPGHASCVQAMAQWMAAQGLAEVLARSEVALMVCRGARYHHDSVQYGHAAFCNLFISDDKGLDLHFPATGQRIPLRPGVAVIFDTGQPHAVVERGASHFDAGAFPPARDCSQVFLTWELSLECAPVAQALQIRFDVQPVPAPNAMNGRAVPQLWHNGAAVDVCAASGRWLAGSLAGP